ncbi:MAG: glycoside hydrolase N-terminal domain-containing protein, partial [Sedimentisphaerales bacterium]
MHLSKLVKTYINSILVGLALAAFAYGQPKAEHGLHYKTPATVWDEAMPLGNGLFGALVWGDGRPLRISLDRTDLWDLRPVPEFSSKDYSYRTMRQWVKEGRLADLHRLYDDPYGNPGPTKIPAGRIELTVGDDAVFENASLDLASAAASVEFKDNSRAEVFVHASEPFGMIRISSARTVSIKLLAPPFAGKITDEAGPGKISAGDLASLRYEAPVESSGDNWTGYLQQGWGGFRFAVVVCWRKSESTWVGAWSIATSNESEDPLMTARSNCEKALQSGFSNAISTHRQWWDSYWDKSSVRIPNKIIERQWYLEMYKFGAAARQNTPPISLQGPWT